MKLGQRMSLGQLEEMHQLALEGEQRAADLQEHGRVPYDSQGVHEEMGPG